MNFYLKGTATALVIGLLTIPTVMFPWLQYASLSHSSLVLDLVRSFVEQGTETTCDAELTWVSVIYFGLILGFMAVFYHFRYWKGIGMPWLVGMVMVQFYLLQVPFFIMFAGTDYNCVANPDAMDAVYIGSTFSSGLLVVFGAVFDWIEPRSKD